MGFEPNGRASAAWLSHTYERGGSPICFHSSQTLTDWPRPLERECYASTRNRLVFGKPLRFLFEPLLKLLEFALALLFRPD